MLKVLGLLMVAGSLLMSGCASQNYASQMKSPQIDRISEAELARIMTEPVAALSLDDLVKLSKEGATANEIIEKIKQTNSMYDLSPSQSIRLHEQGLDNQVLDYIHLSREQAVRNNVADEINKREKSKRDELDKLKRLQSQQQRMYDPFCNYGPYGFSPYGAYYGRRFGMGARFGRPWGCW